MKFLLLLLVLILLLMLVYEPEEMRVFVLDVCQFIGHFAFEEEVAQVSLLEEPPVEVTKGSLAVTQGFGLIRQGRE